MEKPKIVFSSFETLHDNLNAYIFHQVRKALQLLPNKTIEGLFCYIIVSDMDDYNPKNVAIFKVSLNDSNKVVMETENGDIFIEDEHDFRDITDLETSINHIIIEAENMADLPFTDLRTDFCNDVPYQSFKDFDEADLFTHQHKNRCLATINKYNNYLVKTYGDLGRFTLPTLELDYLATLIKSWERQLFKK